MEKRTYIQCRNCGHIYYINDNLSIEDFIVKSECPKCGNKYGINCGKNIEDIYLFYDNTKDPRFYLY